MSSFRSFIGEIHRRSLWQVLLIYVGGALVAYQAVQALTEGLGLPHWFPGFALILFIIGLPVVLATAFIQEGGPSAGRRDPTLLPDAPERPADIPVGESAVPLRLFTWRNAVLGGLFAFSLWGVIATGWLLIGRDKAAAGDSGSTRMMLVVLPFENLGPAEDEYFADGITEEITARLAKVDGLGIIARTSAILYKDSDKSVETIGEELGVDYVLEGTVRWEHTSDGGSRVRVTPQLISSGDATHLWAEVYERDIASIFQVQSDIAQKVTDALGLALFESVGEDASVAPTDNLEAFDYYLRGNDYANRSWDYDDLTIAAQMYERAVELDPEFAAAHARLSVAHSDLYWYYHDRSEARLDMSKRAAERAIRLNPELSYGYIAMGYYYYHGLLDYENALEQFAIAERYDPNSIDVLQGSGYVLRRSGRWDEGIEKLRRVAELDPRSAITAHAVGASEHWVRNYAEALPFLDRAISLSPDWASGYVTKTETLLAWEGDVESARRVVEQLVAVHGPDGLVDDNLVAGNGGRTLFRIFHDSYGQALLGADSVVFGGDAPTFHLIKAEYHRIANETERARAHFEAARSLLEDRVVARPDESLFHSQLGFAYAGLGQADEAIREGKRAVELLPVSHEAWYGPDRVEDLAHIYVMIGDYDAAVEQLEFLLSVPGRQSAKIFAIDPAWDALRDHPNFQALLKSDR
jgi:serine/threonine-protein kinase